MASNVFARLVTPSRGGRSFYEELRGRDDSDRDRDGLLDEENLNHNFHDYDLENAGLNVDDSQPTLPDRANPRGRRTSGGRPHQAWPSQDEDIDNNDVPASLLMETPDDITGPYEQPRRNQPGHRTHAIPGPSRARPQWEATQARQRLHNDDAFGPRRVKGAPGSFLNGMISGSSKKKAEWRWANVTNLDAFIKDVYDYYIGCGLHCIILERVLHLV